MKDDDLEEIELNEEPVGPTTLDLCKQWFEELCSDINIKKTYFHSQNSKIFGNEDRLEYPYLKRIPDGIRYHYYIHYKDYSSEIGMVDGERLWNMFNDNIDPYYKNIFKIKLEQIRVNKENKKSSNRDVLVWMNQSNRQSSLGPL